MKLDLIMDFIKKGKNIIDDYKWLIDEGDFNFKQKNINMILNMVEHKRFLHTDFDYDPMMETHDKLLKFEEFNKEDKEEIKYNEKLYGMNYKEMVKRTILFQLSYSSFLCTKQSENFSDEDLLEKTHYIENYKGDEKKTFPVIGPRLVFLPYKTFAIDFSVNNMDFLDGEDGCYIVSSFWHFNDKYTKKPNKAYICIYPLDADRLVLNNLKYGYFLEFDMLNYNPIRIDYDAGEKAGISKKVLYLIFQYLMTISVKINNIDLSEPSGYRRTPRHHSNNTDKNETIMDSWDTDRLVVNSPLKNNRQVQNYDLHVTVPDDYDSNRTRHNKPHTTAGYYRRQLVGHGKDKHYEIRWISEYETGKNNRDDRPFIHRTEPGIDPDDIINIDDYNEEDTDNEQEI